MTSNFCIIGSVAVQFHLPLFRRGRKPEDLDVFISEKSPNRPRAKMFSEYDRVEYHLMDRGIIKLMLEGSDGPFPTLNNLYTLKLSHVFWNINLEKTINDIIFLSRSGAVVNKKLFYKLKSHWKEVHGGKEFLSLNKSKDDFFDDAVEKVVEHDLIHEWVAKYERPLYTRCLKDGEDVLLDWDKFSELELNDRIHMIREETMVIAIERFAIKKSFDIPSGICYSAALKIVITRLMKGRFANFIAFNLDSISRYRMTEEYLFCKNKILENEY